MKKRIYFPLISILMVFAFTACTSKDNLAPADNDSVKITVWHYYTGALASEFNELISEFNNTAGKENGIFVSAESMSSITDLENALLDSASEKIGTPKMPNIFQCGQDTAVTIDNMVGLVNFNNYVSEDVKVTYVRQFLDSGRIGKNKEWKIFPIAASTEILMINKTDWHKFSFETGTSINDLSTWEGLANTAEKYYEWSGGRAFFGHDDFANFLIAGSSQLGHEIFKISNDSVELDLDKETMRKIWDNFYVPYIKGYYKHVGKLRSDDLKIGEIIALVCPTSSASYFPSNVTLADGSSYLINYQILPLPNFEGTVPYAVQQGAGMAVTKSTQAEEAASVKFLLWLTQEKQDLRFSIKSGYMPVTVESLKDDVISEYVNENSAERIMKDILNVSLGQYKNYIMYTPAGFLNGTQAKELLGTSMPELAQADYDAIEAGASIDDFLNDEHFEEWYNDTLSSLNKILQIK